MHHLISLSNRVFKCMSVNCMYLQSADNTNHSSGTETLKLYANTKTYYI